MWRRLHTDDAKFDFMVDESFGRLIDAKCVESVAHITTSRAYATTYQNLLWDEALRL